MAKKKVAKDRQKIWKEVLAGMREINRGGGKTYRVKKPQAATLLGRTRAA